MAAKGDHPSSTGPFVALAEPLAAPAEKNVASMKLHRAALGMVVLAACASPFTLTGLSVKGLTLAASLMVLSTPAGLTQRSLRRVRWMAMFAAGVALVSCAAQVIFVLFDGPQRIAGEASKTCMSAPAETFEWGQRVITAHIHHHHGWEPDADQSVHDDRAWLPERDPRHAAPPAHLMNMLLTKPRGGDDKTAPHPPLEATSVPVSSPSVTFFAGRMLRPALEHFKSSFAADTPVSQAQICGRLGSFIQIALWGASVAGALFQLVVCTVAIAYAKHAAAVEVAALSDGARPVAVVTGVQPTNEAV